MRDTKERQISVRLPAATHKWLTERAPGERKKAEFVRNLINEEMRRARERELLDMFNEAAQDVTEADRQERDSLVGGFTARR